MTLHSKNKLRSFVGKYFTISNVTMKNTGPTNEIDLYNANTFKRLSFSHISQIFNNHLKEYIQTFVKLFN